MILQYVLALLLSLVLCTSVFAQGLLINGDRTVAGTINFCVDTGGVNAYSCNLSPAILAYKAGSLYAFNASTTNTGPATLALNGLSVLTIKKVGGGITTDLSANDIRSGQVVAVYYDGTNLQMVSGLGSVTGTGSQVLQTSPTLTTPILGVATATTLNRVTITQPATSATLTITNGKTVSFNNGLVFSGTDASGILFGSGGTVAYVGGAAGAVTSGWTPIDASGASLTFSSAVGKYQQIGSIVYYSFRVTYPVTADASAAIIGGLPITVNNNDRDNTYVGIYSSGTTVSGVNSQGSTQFTLNTPNTTTAVANSAVSGLTLRGSSFYFVN